jgi:hypothetical protein
MRRREFIWLLGGAATAWPLAVRSQQAESVPRIGVLMNLAADDPEGQARLTGLLHGLQESGWADGRNAHIDTRWGPDAGSTRKYAAELVALAPDVILASAATSTLQQTTRTGADRICKCRRSGRCLIRREPGTPGRQPYRGQPVRLRPQRQMAGATQRDRAQDDPSSGPSRSHSGFRIRSVCHHPGGGAVAWGRVAPDRHA